MQLLLDELAECVTGAESPETDLLKKELTTSLNRFFRGTPRSSAKSSRPSPKLAAVSIVPDG